jgi:hypothetical protein
MLRRAYATLHGFDDETGSVPMMDGPLRPNALLDAAPVALTLQDVDNLTPWRDGLSCSSGRELLHLARASERLVVKDRRAFEAPVSFVAAGCGDGMAIGLDEKGVLVIEGAHAGRMITRVGGLPLLCPTTAVFLTPDELIIASGSIDHSTAEWKRDLMERGDLYPGRRGVRSQRRLFVASFIGLIVVDGIATQSRRIVHGTEQNQFV